MRCRFCGFTNGEDDHRCLRCGRRTAGVVIAAPAAWSGANALAVAPALDPAQTLDVDPLRTPAPQPALFPATAQKVIPFDELHRHVTAKLSVQAPAAPPRAVEKPVVSATPNKAPARRTPPATSAQTSIDFVPAPASAPRTLKTAVPAQIYCDHPVATPIHRFVAGAMDAAMIFIAFGLFLVITQVAGGSFGQGKLFWGMMLTSYVLISLFYGLLWNMARRETPGMHWTELQLVTFDGFVVEPRTRAARTAATWLSFCAGGIGVLWAIADEEKLTWHDHISKTFPTPRELQGSFNRSHR